MGKILRFLLGSVRIEVNGRFPERFLNLCGGRHLSFWDVKVLDEQRLSVCLSAHRLHESRRLAAQALCELRVLEGNGLPCFLYRMRRRFALGTGLALALFGAIFLSQFVLVIQVTGNERLSDSVILTELERQGFGPGVYGPGVDRRTLANEVLLRLPELSFLSVNISGIRAQVVVREAAPEPELEDRWAPGDVVASADGVVVGVDPIIGRAVVQEGQAVLQGELLLSGTEEQESGDGTGTVLSTTQVRAEGRVWALTRRTLRAVTPLSVSAKDRTDGRKTLRGLRVLGRGVKFYRESSFFTRSCDRIRNTYPLRLPGVGELPLAWETLRLEEYTLRSAQIKRKSAETLLKTRLEERLAALLEEDGEVLGKSLCFQEEDGVLVGTLTASCREDIGVMVPRQAAPGGKRLTGKDGTSEEAD